MKIIAIPMTICALQLAACSTDLVSPELDELETLGDETEERVSAIVAPRLEGEAEAADRAKLEQAATELVYYHYTEDCRALLARDIRATGPEACRVTTDDAFDPAIAPGPATAVARKMTVLGAYINALVLLSEPSEDPLVTAFGEAFDSLSDLGDTGRAEGLRAFLDDRADDREAIEAGGKLAISTARFARMRRVVSRSDKELQDLVREINVGLYGVAPDAELANRMTAMETAEADFTEAFATGDRAAYVASVRDMRRARDAYVAHFETTVFHDISLIGRYHAALARAFADNATAEDVLDYLEALKAVHDKIEEA